MRNRLITLMCATAVLTASCGKSGGGNALHDRCGPIDAQLTAVTYNAALGPGMVSLATPRTAPVAAAIAATEFDVLCLQEVWTKDGSDAVIAALGLPPTNVLTIDTSGLGESYEDTCTADELRPLQSCVRKRCADVPDEQTTICALDQCHGELTNVYLRDKGCLNCLAASAGKSPDGIVNLCTSDGASRIQGGRNDVILASRWKLKNKEVVQLISSGANRVALLARVDVPQYGSVEVACAHLSSPDAIPPSQSGFATWEDEQIAELKMISDRLFARANGRPSLLLGDMNAGPALSSTINASSKTVWDAALQLGFTSPAADSQPPFCSICGDNTLRYGRSSSLVDHVFIRNAQTGTQLQSRCVDRLFDTPATITGYDSKPVVTNLSDHYGVRVKLLIQPDPAVIADPVKAYGDAIKKIIPQ